MTKKETRKIDEVISELRDEADAFARRIQPVYALLDWKWSNGGESKVPSVEDIQGNLAMLINALERLLRQKSATPIASTGGLTALAEEKSGLLTAHIEFAVRKVAYAH